MKLIYWGLKGNQGIMVTYISICFSIELIWCVMTELYVYINHFSWNETSALRIERKSRYHGYINIYALERLNWYDMWYEWLKWNQITGYWNEIKVSDCIWIYVVWLRLKWNQGIGIAYEFMWYD